MRRVRTWVAGSSLGQRLQVVAGVGIGVVLTTFLLLSRVHADHLKLGLFGLFTAVFAWSRSRETLLGRAFGLTMLIVGVIALATS
jgi:hypothetical protein